MFAIDKLLKICSEKLDRVDDDKKMLAQIEKALTRIEKKILSGPMRQVYEATAGVNQVEIQKPATRQIILLLELQALVYGRKVQVKNDIFYKQAIDKANDAIIICDESESKRMGAELRLLLAKMLVKWMGSSDQMKDEVSNLLDWIISLDIANSLGEILEEARILKSTIMKSTDETISEVVRTMNVVQGYNYGGDWSGHWYECRNGHPYFIGECGGAMQTSRCIECGEEVGGSSHTLLSHNTTSSSIARIMEQARN